MQTQAYAEIHIHSSTHTSNTLTSNQEPEKVIQVFINEHLGKRINKYKYEHMYIELYICLHTIIYFDNILKLNQFPASTNIFDSI